MKARFAGRVAVVTGAASGIGEATALRLAAEGAAVVIADIAQAGAAVRDRVRAGVEVENGRAEFVQADVSSEDDWTKIIAAAHQFGPVDVLVSNAFSVSVKPAHDTSRESWDRQIGVSLTGTFLGVRAALDDLRAQRGSVVITSSVHANFGFPGHPAYAAAKGGLVALGRQLAVEYGPEVRVNSVLPGPILTPHWNSVSEADKQRTVVQTVAQRFGTAEETAAAIAFLASDEASYITGASLVVDGGWSAFKDSA